MLADAAQDSLAATLVDDDARIRCTAFAADPLRGGADPQPPLAPLTRSRRGWPQRALRGGCRSSLSLSRFLSLSLSLSFSLSPSHYSLLPPNRFSFNQF